jgi:tyrosyl-tRNA synthetase
VPDVEEKLDLVSMNTEEIVTRSELRSLLETKSNPRAYWGFECSGFMHIGIGLVTGSKIMDMVNAGFDFIIFLADWHSWINNKLGGDMDNIRKCGEYFKDCFTALGIPQEKVRYIWASELTADRKYWEKVVRIGKLSSLQRVLRALPIMGRSMEPSDIEAATLMYPCMQAADIFHMELDVACAGMDQRKAHMLARDVADRIGRKKPICVHTPLLSGLQEPSAKEAEKFDEDAEMDLSIRSKMSKSKAGSAILVHDSPDEISSKIRAAYCPPRITKGNPVFEIAKYIVFQRKREIHIPRDSKYGGPVDFRSVAELEREYSIGQLHPLDLKKGVTDSLVQILEPTRRYFETHNEHLEVMKKMEITR